MQGKGVVRFFLILMTIVCLVQYLFMLPTRKVDRAAEEFAAVEAAKYTDENQAYAAAKVAKSQFLDSMNSETVLSIPLIKDFTYDELKSRQLAYGLDLKGGMSATLEVDLKDALASSLSNNSKDETFLQALENTDARMKSSQSDYVTVFQKEFEKIAGEKNLASIFARNPAFREDLTFNSSNDEVIRVIKGETDGIVNRTFELLKKRIDKLGVVQPNVSLDAARNLILVELPGIENEERARNFLQSAAKLEFWDVYQITEGNLLNKLIEEDQRLKRLEQGDSASTEEVLILDTIYEERVDSTGNIDSVMVVDTIDATDNPFANRGPLLSMFDLNVNTGQGFMNQLAVIGMAEGKNKDKVKEIIENMNGLPQDLLVRWSRDPIVDQGGKETTIYQLYGIKKKRGSDKAPIEGDRVVTASSDLNPMEGQIEVTMRFDNQGAKKWADMTTKAYQDNNRSVAIVLDDEVVSAPRVNVPITGGNTSIQGDFTVQDGADLASILQIGKLPAKTRIVQQSTVGPSLGKKNIRKSLTSLGIGVALVLIFMILYYGGGGIVSIIALFANLFFIFGALASYGTVLTIPGFAGIVLTIGMAVDANVIIFERIREELREGKSLLMGIKDGFQNSYSAIIDANVTTLLVAFVLVYFGLGPIKGFAVVLIIGVIFSFATAVFLSRLIIDFYAKGDRKMSFWTPISKNALANLNIDWISKRKVAYIISSVVIAAGLVSFFVRKFDLGVDFKGGYSYNIEFDQSVNVEREALSASLTEALGSAPVLKSVDTRNTFNVVTDYLIDDDAEDAPDRVMAALHKGVEAVTGQSIDFEQFKSSDALGTHIVSGSKVGPTIADDIKQSSIYATIFALLFIFLYIFLRFNKWQYSLGAVAALFHDTLVVLSFFSLLHGILPFSMEIDQPFIGALLTVIGYSINDTVVVFDRIREFMKTYTRKTKKEVFNMAINSTVSRTIITSLTTFFVVLMLFVFGGASIKGFAVALLVGIIVGTYSSIFVATPIVYDLTGEVEVKDKKKKHFSKALNA